MKTFKALSPMTIYMRNYSCHFLKTEEKKDSKSKTRNTALNLSRYIKKVNNLRFEIKTGCVRE